MSLYVLATGPLVANPLSRSSAKGSPFTTATLRVATDDEVTLVSLIAFSEHASQLLKFAIGDTVAVSGRAKLTHWTGRDGVEKHGLSVVAEQIAAAKPRAKSAERAQQSVRKPHSRRSSEHYARPLREDRVDDLWPLQ